MVLFVSVGPILGLLIFLALGIGGLIAVVQAFQVHIHRFRDHSQEERHELPDDNRP